MRAANRSASYSYRDNRQLGPAEHIHHGQRFDFFKSVGQEHSHHIHHASFRTSGSASAL